MYSFIDMESLKKWTVFTCIKHIIGLKIYNIDYLAYVFAKCVYTDYWGNDVIKPDKYCNYEISHKNITTVSGIVGDETAPLKYFYIPCQKERCRGCTENCKSEYEKTDHPPNDESDRKRRNLAIYNEKDLPNFRINLCGEGTRLSIEIKNWFEGVSNFKFKNLAEWLQFESYLLNNRIIRGDLIDGSKTTNAPIYKLRLGSYPSSSNCKKTGAVMLTQKGVQLANTSFIPFIFSGNRSVILTIFTFILGTIIGVIIK